MLGKLFPNLMLLLKYQLNEAENAYASFEIKEGVLFFIYKEGIDIDLATARK